MENESYIFKEDVWEKFRVYAQTKEFEIGSAIGSIPDPQNPDDKSYSLRFDYPDSSIYLFAHNGTRLKAMLIFLSI
jgi:hypothetical protein